MDYRYSDRLKDLKANSIREIFKVLQDPAMISFAGGFPAIDCLPKEAVANVMNKISKSSDFLNILQYGGTEGYLPLRQTAIKYLERVGLNNVELDETLIISGGQQGIDLTFKSFINKGDVILVQSPTYLAALHIAKTYEAQTIGVQTDDEGLDIEDLERKIKEYNPKVLYVVPNFSNPTGKTFGIEKRKAIAELTAKHNVIVLEDDPYRELRYSGEPLPAIKTFDKAGNVIYVTSFSKSIAPGLRVGVACGQKDVIRKMTIAKQAVDVHTSTLSQAIVNEFLNDGSFDRQLQSCIPRYRFKRDKMIEALDKFMPMEFQFTRPEGGLFVWGEFDENSGIDVTKCFMKAIDSKVAYVSGVDFYADGSGKNSLRLNFSNAPVEVIDKGVLTLSKIFRDELTNI